MKSILIGGVEIAQTAALAPMASVADRAYRLICKKYGASYTVSEMISAKGLCYGDGKTAEMCSLTAEERPAALQLFGEDPVFIGHAVEILNVYSPDIIDINMGCPVPKIVKGGAGSALMKTPERAQQIVSAAVRYSQCPVTVKIRSGWDENDINAVEFAKRMEYAGAAAIAVHPRTRRQMYSGKADWNIISQVRKAVSVPVIGNGDVTDCFMCRKMYEDTGCDLVMVGRGSYGAPWIFEDIKNYLENAVLPKKRTDCERMEIMLSHARLLIEEKGEERAVREMRKNVIWYLKGMRGAARLRSECSEIVKYCELEELVRKAIYGDRIFRDDPERESENG